MALPTLEYLHAILSYDEDTGLLKWRHTGRGRKLNLEAGCITKGVNTDYMCICIDYIQYASHRIIWFMYYGEWPEGEIDHEDHNGLNNRICNLRDVEHAHNHQNRPITKFNPTGCMGVTWAKKDRCWRVRIKVKGREIHIGHFKVFEDAVKARKRAEEQYGFHENHSEP